MLYLVALFVAAFAATSKGQSCGEQIMDMRECGKDVKEMFHPQMYQKRNESYMLIQQCFTNAGCLNPCETIPEMLLMYLRYTLEWIHYFVPHWHYELIMKMITQEYGMCLQKEVFQKVIFPRVEECVGEKFMIGDYELPKLSYYFMQKHTEMEHYRKKRSMDGMKSGHGKEMFERMYREMSEQLSILAASMSEAQLFNLEDPQIAQDLVWYVGDYACANTSNPEASMAQARSCIEGVAQDYWSNEDGTCKTPVAMAFEARDKMYDYCMEKQQCYGSVNETCMEVFQKEPKMLCQCGCHLPLEKDYRMDVQKGLMTCLDVSEADMMENKDLAEVMYMTTIEMVEKLGMEFCQLKRKIPCKKAFGDELMNTPTPDPNPNPDPMPNDPVGPNDPQDSLLDQLKNNLQAMRESLAG